MLALLVPLRRGGGDFTRFGRYADAMLEEKEFFIRKAIGWVLRDTAAAPDLVAGGSAAGPPGLRRHGSRGGEVAPDPEVATSCWPPTPACGTPGNRAGRDRPRSGRQTAAPASARGRASSVPRRCNAYYDRRDRASAAGGSPASRGISLVRWA